MCLHELLLRKSQRTRFYSCRGKKIRSIRIESNGALTLLCILLRFILLPVLIIVLQLHFFFFLSVSEQVTSPPVAGAFRERPSRPTTFRKFYERREFPIALSHDTKGHRIAWKVGALTCGSLGWLVLGCCHFKEWELCRLETSLAHSD